MYKLGCCLTLETFLSKFPSREAQIHLVSLLPHSLCTEIGRATWILPEVLFFLGLPISHGTHTSCPVFSIFTPSVEGGEFSFLSVPPLLEYPFSFSSDLCQLLSLSPLLWTSSKCICVPLYSIYPDFLSIPRFHSLSVILQPPPSWLPPPLRLSLPPEASPFLTPSHLLS